MADGYDFIWVLLWDSQSSRDACWDDWTSNLQSNWDTMIDGIMQYDLDNVYLFGWTIGQYPKVENDSNGNHHRKTLRPWDNRKREQSMKAKQSSYNCEICGNKYSTKYILKKHVWNVHED